MVLFFLDITLFLDLVSHQNFLMSLLGSFYIHLHLPYCVKSVRIWELFWSVFSRIRTEYGEILLTSPYSVQILENTDHNHSKYGHFLRSGTPNSLKKEISSSSNAEFKHQFHCDGFTKVLPKQLFVFSLLLFLKLFSF